MNKFLSPEDEALETWIAALGTPGEAAALAALRAAQLAAMEEDDSPEAPPSPKELLDLEADERIAQYERSHNEAGWAV